MPLSGAVGVKGFIAIDFFGNSNSASNALRVREAYGEVTNVLFGGDLLLGQTWSAFRNLQAVPNTLDFQGPNAALGARRPQARWTKRLGSSPFTLRVSLEAPDNRAFDGAEPLARVPDGSLALVWKTGAVNVQASVIGRDLRASTPDGGKISAFGWGASLAGRIYMPGVLSQDFWTFSLTYGQGIGGVVNDDPLDAAYDATTDRLKALPDLAYYAGYQHWWSTALYSVICYGEVWHDTLAFQAPTVYEHTRYATLNLSFTPSPSWLFGIEALYGSREDKDGEQGWDARGLFSSRFKF